MPEIKSVSEKDAKRISKKIDLALRGESLQGCVASLCCFLIVAARGFGCTQAEIQEIISDMWNNADLVEAAKNVDSCQKPN